MRLLTFVVDINIYDMRKMILQFSALIGYSRTNSFLC